MSDDDLERLRQETDPGTRAEGVDAVDRNLQDAIRNELAAIERDDASKTLSLRDERLAALVRALDETGDIDAAGAELRATLGREDDDSAVDRSELLRLAVRVGLAESVPATLDVARDAYADHAADRF